ncbi:MAG: glycosyltransferase, partial [Armatimonadetes bacterium]|nr:glycosyltransferase [Armatimonadota bacterium]
MTILRLAKRVPPCLGGQERHVLELTLEQAALGHRVVLLYADGQATGGDGWEGHSVGRTGRLGSSLESLRFALAAQRYVRRHPTRFDLVHAHGDYAEAFAAVRLGRYHGCPAVLTCHGSFGRDQPWRVALRRAAFGRLGHLFLVSPEQAERVRRMGVATPVTVQHSGTRVGPLRAIPRSEAAAPLVVAVG